MWLSSTVVCKFYAEDSKPLYMPRNDIRCVTGRHHDVGSFYFTDYCSRSLTLGLAFHLVALLTSLQWGLREKPITAVAELMKNPILGFKEPEQKCFWFPKFWKHSEPKQNWTRVSKECKPYQKPEFLVLSQSLNSFSSTGVHRFVVVSEEMEGSVSGW